MMACNKRKLTLLGGENKKSKVHDATHEDVKSYPCLYCDWVFSSEDTLHCHCKDKHMQHQDNDNTYYKIHGINKTDMEVSQENLIEVSALVCQTDKQQTMDKSKQSTTCDSTSEYHINGEHQTSAVKVEECTPIEVSALVCQTDKQQTMDKSKQSTTCDSASEYHINGEHQTRAVKVEESALIEVSALVCQTDKQQTIDKSKQSTTRDSASEYHINGEHQTKAVKEEESALIEVSALVCQTDKQQAMDKSKQSRCASEYHIHGEQQTRGVKVEECTPIEVSEDSQESDLEWSPDLSEFCDTKLVIDEEDGMTDAMFEREITACNTLYSNNQTEHDSPQLDKGRRYEEKFIQLNMLRYHCKVCPMSFSLKHNCLRHVLVQHSKTSSSLEYIESRYTEVYQCMKCKTCSVSKILAEEHASLCSLSHLQDSTCDSLQKYVCNICKKNMHKKFVYLRHIRDMHPECYQVNYGASNNQMYTCNNCGEMFYTPELIAKHLNTCQFNSTEVGRESSNKITHEQITAVTVERYVCKICDASFSSKRTRNRHMLSFHSGYDKSSSCLETTQVEMYTCKVCQKIMKPHLVQDHIFRCKTVQNINTEVTGDYVSYVSQMKKRYVCKICNVSFSAVGSGLRHMNTIHLAYKNAREMLEVREVEMYVCKRCDSMFTTTKLVTEHVGLCARIPHVLQTSSTPTNTTLSVVTCLESHVQVSAPASPVLQTSSTSTNTTLPVVTCLDSHVHASAPVSEDSLLKTTCTDNNTTLPAIQNYQRRVTMKSVSLYKCIVCSSYFSTVQAYVSHVNKEHSSVYTCKYLVEMMYQCLVCLKYVPTKQHSCRDLPVTHSMALKGVVVCPICDKLFSRVGTCKEHIKKMHKHEGNVEAVCKKVVKKMQTVGMCHLCSNFKTKVHASEMHLQKHMITHGVFYPETTEQVHEQQQEQVSILKNTLLGQFPSKKMGNILPSQTEEDPQNFTLINQENPNIKGKDDNRKAISHTWSQGIDISISSCDEKVVTCTVPEQDKEMPVQVVNTVNNSHVIANTSSMDNTTHFMDNTTSSMDKTTTCMENTTSSKDNTTHFMDKTTSSMDNTTTYMDKTTSSMDNTTLSMDNTVPYMDKTTSCIDNTTTSMDKTTSSMDNTTPSMDNTNFSIVQKRVVACPVCDKLFTRTDRCKKHIETEHRQYNVQVLCENIGTKINKVFKCNICKGFTKNLFFNKGIYDLHWMQKHNKLPWDTSDQNDAVINADENSVYTCDNESIEKIEYFSERDEALCELEDSEDLSSKHKNSAYKYFSMVKRAVATCPVCKKIFCQACRCKRHMKKHHPEENLEVLYSQVHNKKHRVGICHMCPKTSEKMFDNEMSLAQHMLQHGVIVSGNDVEAPESVELFHTTQQNINITAEHQNNKATQEMMNCNENILIENLSSNKTHSMTIRKVAICPVCNKIYSCLDKCKNHVMKKHFSLQNVAAVYHSIEIKECEVGMCYICPSREGKMFLSKSLLAEHMLIHETSLLQNVATENIRFNVEKRLQPLGYQTDKHYSISNTYQDLQNEGFHFLSSLNSQMFPDTTTLSLPSLACPSATMNIEEQERNMLLSNAEVAYIKTEPVEQQVLPEATVPMETQLTLNENFKMCDTSQVTQNILAQRDNEYVHNNLVSEEAQCGRQGMTGVTQNCSTGSEVHTNLLEEKSDGAEMAVETSEGNTNNNLEVKMQTETTTIITNPNVEIQTMPCKIYSKENSEVNKKTVKITQSVNLCGKKILNTNHQHGSKLKIKPMKSKLKNSARKKNTEQTRKKKSVSNQLNPLLCYTDLRLLLNKCTPSLY